MKRFLRCKSAIIGLFVACCTFMAGTSLFAKDTKGQTVDSGVFGVFIKGTRIATETFQIRQTPEVSIATSEFKTEGSGPKTTQRAELQINSDGNLRRYEWREINPGKAQQIVEPKDEFIVEHIIPNSPEKPQEQPFMLPPSTMILDDYFFSQREVLLWRYLAQSCGALAGPDCKPPKTQFGIVIPRQRASSTVSVEYIGKETVTVRGMPRQLGRFNLTSDGDQWALYIDDNLKLVRIVIASEDTEVVRE